MHIGTFEIRWIKCDLCIVYKIFFDSTHLDSFRYFFFSQSKRVNLCRMTTDNHLKNSFANRVINLCDSLVSVVSLYQRSKEGSTSSFPVLINPNLLSIVGSVLWKSHMFLEFLIVILVLHTCILDSYICVYRMILCNSYFFFHSISKNNSLLLSNSFCLPFPYTCHVPVEVFVYMFAFRWTQCCNEWMKANRKSH